MAQAFSSFSEPRDEDDAAFLSAIAEAEADGMRRLSQDGMLSRKYDRQRSEPAESVASSLPSFRGVGSVHFPNGNEDGVHSYNEKAAAPKRSRNEPEGEYMAALRGTHSETWQALSSKVAPDVKRRYGAAASHSSANLGGGDGTGGQGNSTGGCFHCGKDGHWARDCPSKDSMTPSSWGPDGSNVPGQTSQAPQRACPCGAGTCLVLTANTEKNAGRQFYKCPLRKEEGQCGFFEWCDGITSPNQGAFKGQGISHKQADFPCPCGAGPPCIILTAKTEKNMGRQFYRCPLKQAEGNCGFFKWCDESAPASGTAGAGYGGSAFEERTAMPNVASGHCYKCGLDGHWAKDCTAAGQSASPKGYVGTMRTGQIEGGTGGTCYKCNQAGHWANNCPYQQSSRGGVVGGFNRQGGYSSPGSGGRNAGVAKSISSGGCFKCGSDGHWSKDCPNASNTRQSNYGGYSQAAYGGKSSFSGKSGGGGSCYKCGGQGHWANECQADGKGGRSMY